LTKRGLAIKIIRQFFFSVYNIVSGNAVQMRLNSLWARSSAGSAECSVFVKEPAR
jgi:hypothetical protein